MYLSKTVFILTAREVSAGETTIDPRAAVDAAFAEDDEDDGYAAAAADFKVRYFLKVKQGPLLRYFNKGYEPRWIYLVDQHLLDFENEESVVPSRVYELKYPHTVVVRVCICIENDFFSPVITKFAAHRLERTFKLRLRSQNAITRQYGCSCERKLRRRRWIGMQSWMRYPENAWEHVSVTRINSGIYTHLFILCSW